MTDKEKTAGRLKQARRVKWEERSYHQLKKRQIVSLSLRGETQDACMELEIENQENTGI